MSLLWDQHTCLPLQTGAEVHPLTRYRRDGGAFLSVNAGYAPHSFDDTVALLRHYRAAVEAHPDLELAANVAEVDAISRAGRIAVAFDLEDSAPLDGDLDNLAALMGLGVRTLLPTYNQANRAGSGCLDATDGGLTAWGRLLVSEMNDVGVVPDGSHCSARTGLDMCEVSTGPVVYSHSCMRALWDHPRNITDDQARACAATGGVIGITGVGIFLGPNTPTLEAMTRHLEYAVELVGIDHVGVSTDFSFDFADFVDEVVRNPHLFDDSYTRWGPIQWMPPETFLGLEDHLRGRGWSVADIHAVLGGNFRRVAGQIWDA
ncbi:membrane dipeptidase [Mycobacterium sp. IEC1808]|uniref:dipeptidase n=1 Tax=Mycobacterium sp. IEC1808 TaxID=1743230 RepID=UPI000A15A2B0|nr:membrane dipeptidase [Mycobacterium sp. IEC1808]ORW96601.1 membrane dipeptidase [Mycobacterium sp. IEC1808]